MKRTFAKQSLKSLVAMFLLFGALMFAATRAEAQVIGPDNLNWKTEAAAISVLEPAIDAMATQLTGLIPGTSGYEQMQVQLSYTKHIHAAIADGSTTAEAAINSLDAVNIQKVDSDPQTPVIRKALYDFAKDLLTD